VDPSPGTIRTPTPGAYPPSAPPSGPQLLVGEEQAAPGVGQKVLVALRAPAAPPGLIAHLAWRTESGLRYVDVWQSEDDHQAFAENRLHPVVHPILQDMLGFVPPEPAHTELDVIDAWTTTRHPA
jgi:hypothetical protein